MTTPRQQIDKKFVLSTSIIKKLKVSPSTSDLLELYALYKQATLGDCRIPKPSVTNIRDYQKWNAWNAQLGTDSDTAKELYSHFVLDLVDRIGI